MPTFKTPQPISVTLELYEGDVRILASDRKDTVVEVSSSGGSKTSSTRATEQTRVDYVNGRLLIKGSKPALFGRDKGGPVDVTIELPTGSSLQGRTAVGGLHAEGRLGECQFKTATGDVSLDHCGPLTLQTGMGDVSVNRSVGQIHINSASGSVRVREMDGVAVIRIASGETSVGDVNGELRLNAANGDIAIGRVSGQVVANAASGNIRVNEVVRGSIQLTTATGELEIGIAEGTAAWLDASTRNGKVRNSMSTDAGSRQPNERAEIRARTYHGDIVIRRPMK